MPEDSTIPSAPKSPSVDVIIVNWNGGPGVASAARSAVRFGGRAIVVDNGSSDGSIDQLREEPGVSIVEMGYNAGFARACNAGASSSDGDYIFLLNPDAEIVSGRPTDIVDALDAFPAAGIVGSRIIDSAGKSGPSVREFPTVTDLVLYQIKLHPWARRIPPLRRYFMIGFDDMKPAYVEQVIGAAMVVRRSDWEAVGGMDSGFFLLFEDVDFCKRLADRGLRAVHWPALVVRHVGHESFRRLGHLRLQRLWNRSLVRYARKHFGVAGTIAIASTIPLSLVLSLILDIGRLPLTGRSDR
jgi:N-acetylglucosaminyl-diphospho-decaprenol L-rhamnosyltransferase